MITLYNRLAYILPDFTVKEMPPEPPIVHTAWLEIHFPKKAQKRQQRSPSGPQGQLWKWLSPAIQFLPLRLGPYQSSNFRSLNRATPNVTTSFPGTKPGVWRQKLSCQNKKSSKLPSVHVGPSCLTCSQFTVYHGHG